MNNNIETRLPFLDINVAKYCFNLSNSLKIKPWQLSTSKKLARAIHARANSTIAQ